jgi:hypothetical protein
MCPVTGAVYTNALQDTCATVSVCGRQVTACLNDPSTLGMLQCLGLL